MTELYGPTSGTEGIELYVAEPSKWARSVKRLVVSVRGRASIYVSPTPNSTDFRGDSLYYNFTGRNKNKMVIRLGAKRRDRAVLMAPAGVPVILKHVWGRVTVVDPHNQLDIRRNLWNPLMWICWIRHSDS